MSRLPAVYIFCLVCCLTGCNRKEIRPPAASTSPPPAPAAEFSRLMKVGKNHFDQGDFTNARAVYQQALLLAPNEPDLRLNLANSHLGADQATEAIREAAEASHTDNIVFTENRLYRLRRP